MSGDLGGFSMFELFKAEAETHCAVLNEGLLAIEAAPDDLATIEPLMRAAHSIKGAARIIGLDDVVTLAHAMEDCLVSAQKGDERLTPGRVDQLLRGVDLLEHVGGLDEAAVPEWSAANAQAIAQLAETLRQAPPTAAEPAPPAPSPPPPAATPVPDARAPTSAGAPSSLGDFSMFELFKAEAETHCAVLNEGLLAIEAAPDDLATIEPLMRAAHSIKGAARIIGLDDVVTLAHAMEDCLVSAQKGDERLASGRVDQLLRGVDLLAAVGGLSEAGLPEWSAANADTVTQLAQALRQPPPAGTAHDAPARSPTAPTAPAAVTAPASPTTGDMNGSRGNRDAAATRSPDSIVRVSAGSLDRMLQLASETMIASRRFQKLESASALLRDAQLRLDTALEDSGRRRTTGAEDLGEIRQLNSEAKQLLNDHLGTLERASWRSERLSQALYNEVLTSRMRPFADGVSAFPRLVRDLARSLEKNVRLEIVGEKVLVDRDILARLEAPLNHILRNCVDHGIELPQERLDGGKPEQGSVVLEARHHAGMLTIMVRDDGRGIDPERIRRKVVDQGMTEASLAEQLGDAELMEFLFLPGFSTAGRVTEVSGRGVGLDVVQSMVQEVSGTVRVRATPGKGTMFTLRLPVTLSVVRAVLARIGGEPYAFPLSRIERILRVPTEDLRPVEGRQQFDLDGESVGLVRAADVLGLDGRDTEADDLSVVLIGHHGRWCGLTVDGFIGEQDLVVRPLDRRLGRVAHISAASILEKGDPVLIVDVEDLYQSVQQRLGEGRIRGLQTFSDGRHHEARRRVLVVDDSITVREVERQLLTAYGYAVEVAVDGRDGWNALCSAPYDLLITDIDMPRMDGIELIRTVRRDPRFTELPIVIVSYKDREEDRLRGLEAGASAFLTKASFHDDSLLSTVTDLIGEPEGTSDS